MQGFGPQPRELRVGAHRLVAPHPGEVGRFDEHDALLAGLVPRVTERGFYLLRVETDAERCGGVGHQQVGGDGPAGDDALAIGERERRVAVDCGGGRVAAVGIRDRGQPYVVVDQLLGDRTELRVVRKAVVLVFEQWEPERNDPARRWCTDRAREHLSGRLAVDPLVDVVLLPVNLRQSDSPSPRTEGEIRVAGTGEMTWNARGRKARNRRVGEEALEVRQLDRLEFTPRHARQREHEYPPHSLRSGRGDCSTSRTRGITDAVPIAMSDGKHAAATIRFIGCPGPVRRSGAAAERA